MAQNPAILRSIAANPAAYPDSPASPVQRVPDAGGAPTEEPAAAEPIALHDAATTAKAQVEAARAALEDLQAQAEMADMIDPAAEKAIASAAEEIAAIDDDLAECVDKLAEARKEHEELMGDGSDGKG